MLQRPWANHHVCAGLNGIGKQARPATAQRLHQQQPSAVHEPLLFLYPRWFATSTPRPQIAPQVSVGESRQEEPYKPSHKNHLSHGREAASRRAGQPRTDGKDEQKRELNNNKEDKARMEKKTTDGGKREHDINSPPSAGLVRRVMGRREVDKRKTRRRQELRDTGVTSAVDWRILYTKLMDKTRRGATLHTKQLERLSMPKNMVGHYPGNLHELFLEVLFMTDCHVQVTSGCASDKDTFHALDLAGAPAAISAAKQRLGKVIRLRSLNDAKDEDAAHDNDNNNNNNNNNSEPIVLANYDAICEVLSTNNVDHTTRAVWARDHRWSREKTIFDIRTPEQWNIATFAIYVEDLVCSVPSRIQRRTTYGLQAGFRKQTSHTDHVTSIMLHLFTKPAFADCLSPVACAAAFTFLTKHRKLPELRRIFDAVDNHQFHFGARPFNACLRAASQANDLRSFNFLLELMLDRGAVPDWETWCAFLTLVSQRSPQNVGEVVHRMRTVGLLEGTRAKAGVAELTIRGDFIKVLKQGGSTPDFIQHYDGMMGGPGWFADSTANRMLAMCAEMGQFADAMNIVSLLRSRGRSPTSVSLNIILKESVAQRNLKAALTAMREIVGSGDGRVDVNELSFTYLFRLAKARRDYNLLRVVWRYACLRGMVSFEMQDSFEKCIVHYLPTAEASPTVGKVASQVQRKGHRGPLFKALGFKAAVGLAAGNVAFEDRGASEVMTDRSKGALKDRIVALASEQQPGAQDHEDEKGLGEKAHGRRAFLRRLVADDMAQAGKLQAAYPLVDMLEAAAELDEVWKSGTISVRKKPDFGWIMEKAIEIQVIPKPDSRPSRGML